MSYPELVAQQNEGAQSYFSTIQAYSDILSCFKLGRSIHPLEPVAPEHSEFFEVSSRRRIRIIHIKPENANDKKINKKQIKENASRRSFRLSTEEYWFTRWNRPMRNAACNCSFRRSQRFSKYFDRLSLVSNKHTRNSVNSIKDTPVNDATTESNLMKIFHVEKYADKIINDILVAAFTEYNVIKAQAQCQTKLSNGIINLAYKSHEDEVDKAVLNYLVNNVTSVGKDQSIKVQNNLSNDDTTNVTLRVKNKSEKNSCSHNSHSQKKKKPLVLLLHGIGSSAEIWWDVIQCLVCTGYEIIAPDLLGHGYSSVPDCAKAYTFSNILKDIITIFDAYVSKTDLEQCIVIGHSFGCSLASALARYREKQVVQLVLISGGGPIPLAAPVTSTEVSVFSCMQCILRPLLFCGVKRTLFYSSRGKHFDVCESPSGVPAHILRYISEGQNWPEGDAAFHRRILIPTLLVHGLQDTTVTLVQECEMERTIPRSFLEVIPTAGHLAMVETPEQLCHMLLCFFQWWTK